MAAPKLVCKKDMTDLEVVHTYLDTQASLCFSILYNRYASKVYAKCLTLLQDETLAEDATQEIFTKIFLNLSRFGGKSQFSTWVYSITYNYCIDFLRRRKKRLAIFTEDIERAPDLADEVPDEELLRMEVHQLKEVLREMPVGDSAILLMKYQDDMSIKDIADILGKTDSAIKMQIKRAKERAKKLKEDLFPPSEI